MRKIIATILLLFIASICRADSSEALFNRAFDSTNNRFKISSSIQAGTNIINGATVVTTAGTAVVLGNQTILSVTLKGSPNNVNNRMFIGTSSVTSANGFAINSGDALTIDTDNLSDIYINSQTSGDEIRYIGLTE